MENLILDDVLHLTATAIIVCSFLVISSRRVIELCSQTQIKDE